MNKIYLTVGAVAVVAGTLFALKSEPDLTLEPTSQSVQTPTSDETAMVSITIPELSGNALVGQTIFENICAACHGARGVGNAEAGPPLIHKIYEPSHHGDESFQRAVAHGVRAHHWRFGDMPAVEGLTRGDVAMVIDYLRTIQRANGIN